MAANTPSQPLVEVKGLSKHFGEGESRVDALRDVTISVGAGEVVGLLGPSGSGKSTLLNAIGSITEPSEGWMRLDGEVVYDNRWLRRDLRRMRLEKIARALANRPRIILADEPTAALDSVRAGIVMDLPRKLAMEQQAAIIAVTHDDKIFDRFDRIFHLRDGRLDDEGDQP
ncbi:MAG: ATP-binding cassette domain-containing protein [Aestuariivirga sp.]